MAAPAFAQGNGLGEQLRSTYLETTMDPNGMKVLKPGSTLVVGIDGVQANPRKNNQAAFENTFKGGQLVTTEKKGLGKFIRKQVKDSIGASGAERPLAAGAKVYLLNVEFLPSADTVVLTVQTCGDCDPKVVDPMNEPYRAKVTFQFVHGALAATDLKHVQQAIDQVFKFADAAADTSATASNAAPPPPPPAGAPPAQAPAAQDQQQFAALPPPPPPTRTLKLGMTIAEVKAGFGEPASIVEAGNKKLIYMYSDKKVTFTDGKVSDVDVK